MTDWPTQLNARAPGKLFVLGEYAVLDGCPAVVAAVDRYVSVELERVAGPPVTRLSARRYGAVEFASAAPPRVDGPLRFLIAAFRAVLDRHPELVRHGWRIRTSICPRERAAAEVGAGSSAAITAAATAALLTAASAVFDRDIVFATALRAHRLAQGGIGSGADVAASVYGGLVHCAPREDALPAVTALPVPKRLLLLAAWTRTHASTTDLVRRYLAARNGDRAARAAFVSATRRTVAAFVRAVRAGGSGTAAIERGGALLEQLSARLRLPLSTPALRDLVRVARRRGASAKLSGAGGGDCGIALTTDPIAADRIRADWRAAGLLPLDVRLCREGVTVVRP